MIQVQKVALIIMDGWAHGKKDKDSNAIFAANTPFIDSLYHKYPNTELLTHGESVGLPPGQMGNSEVGHINIGAGRIVYQELMRINKAFSNKSCESNPVLIKTLEYAVANQKTVHFTGLVSDGGVHSHMDHLKSLCGIASAKGVDKLFVHAITDGRDTDPKSGKRFIADLDRHLSKYGAKIATICGRYYAMDRDNRWPRTREAVNMLRFGQGEYLEDPTMAVQKSYDKGITDEFIKPIVLINSDGNPLATVEKGDVLICFNFRTDRCRQIIKALTQEALPEYGMTPIGLKCVTMTRYDKTFKGVDVLFENEVLSQTLGEVLEANGLSQLRIAETEKYPHVTYFFSGGREIVFEGESRLMIPSPKVATYDLQPEMSAPEVKDALLRRLNERQPDFICLNFANADMVGHTGIFKAAVKAIETVDVCVKAVVEKLLSAGYAVLITADHGNADYLLNDDSTPNTAHSMNPVPLFLLGYKENVKLKPGILSNIAPTILEIMGIDKPAEMDCSSLISEQ